MPDPLIRETLVAFPPCEDLPAPLLEQLTEIGRLISYRPRDRIVSADEAVRGLHVVRSGGALLERGESAGGHLAHLLRPCQSFGEIPLLRRMESYSFDVSATEYGTEIVEIAGEPFLELFEGEPEVPAFMVAALSSKVLMLAERVEELSITSAAPRLARYLLRQPTTEGRPHPEIELGMDRKDLAAVLAITPEHLSRLLRRWADAGLVHPRGRTITLLEPVFLRAIADPGDAREDLA